MARVMISVLATVLVAFASVAQAGDDSGIYIGGSVGYASVDYSKNDGDINFDDDDTAYKVFVGYNFGIIPLIDLGVEGSYVDFGSQDGRLAGTNGNTIEVTGWDAFGVAGLTFGPFGIFAKAGMIAWNADLDTRSFGNSTDSGNDPAYGIGAKFQIASFAIRAEYEYFDLDNVDLDFISVGAAYTF